MNEGHARLISCIKCYNAAKLPVYSTTSGIMAVMTSHLLYPPHIVGRHVPLSRRPETSLDYEMNAWVRKLRWESL